jgi:hypothetical protein
VMAGLIEGGYSGAIERVALHPARGRRQSRARQRGGHRRGRHPPVFQRGVSPIRAGRPVRRGSGCGPGRGSTRSQPVN